METEMLTIFDESGSEIGVATREEVHNKGYWHQTFQCYVIGKENHEEYMYLQLRSHLKKDFANVYDITAAGHILSNETVADGVREVNEELGLNVTYNQLNSLGMFPNVIETEAIKDHELSHVFLYEMTEPMETFILQREEVSGMAKARLYDFISFYNEIQIIWRLKAISRILAEVKPGLRRRLAKTGLYRILSSILLAWQKQFALTGKL